MTDVVALAAELLTLDSSTGAESGAVDFVSKWLVARGWNVTSPRGEPRSRERLGVARRTRRHACRRTSTPCRRTSRRGSTATSLTAAARATRKASPPRCSSPPTTSRTPGEQRVDLLFVVGEEKGSDGARAANRLAADEQISHQRRADRKQARQRREGIVARHACARADAPRTPRTRISASRRSSR